MSRSLGTNTLPNLRELARHRVQDILLVSSLYDSFILSEDGRLNEQLITQFLELNLRNTPQITQVSSGQKALELAGDTRRYNLIITSLELGDMDVVELVRRLHARNITTPVILLAYDNRALTDFVAAHDVSGVERAFLWQGDVRMLLAIVNYIEDKLNADTDVGEFGVQAIILIEDNIRYYSSFLPVIYTELVKHNQRLIPEGINLPDKLARIRARPKLLLCDHYEEAWNYLMAFPDEILGVLSDVQFPHRGSLAPEAGLDFARDLHRIRPDVPVMLQSSLPRYEKLARSIDASFLLKGSPTLMTEVRRFMEERLHFGDFVFRLPDGREVGRASDLKTFEQVLKAVPAASLTHHGGGNDFSRWLKARTEFALAAALRPTKVSDFESPEHLRETLVRSIADYRNDRKRGQVADFDRASFDPENHFYRLGGGSLGGKARGLAFINTLLSQHRVDREFENVSIDVPETVVLGTDVFDEFMEGNNLWDFAIHAEDDEALIAKFLEAALPKGLKQDLAFLLEQIAYPLAIRSSSLLEDSQYQPFAGIYETHMLANRNGGIELRLQALTRAVKRVYASMFRIQAKAFLKSTPYRLEEEKMAVILQRIVGATRGNRYYPNFAGVARSQNFYPTPPLSTNDGIAAVALGLGEWVSQGGNCVRFSPTHPKHLMQFSSVEAQLQSSQREFLAVSLDGSDDGSLSKWDLKTAEADGTLRLLASTYSAENDAIYDGVSRQGVRLVSLAPILKQNVFPLADILKRLLDIGQQGTGAAVELEFAANLDTSAGEPSEFGFLQIRPVAKSRESETVALDTHDDTALVCRSDMVLGHGRVDDCHDVLVVDHDRFDRSDSQRVAHLVAQLNAGLISSRRPYILIGVGRWGSSDPFLGIPVSWHDISGVRVIVEAGFRDFTVTPSQGTHFFQNLTAHNVGYFTVNPDEGQGFVDWAWLKSQPATSVSPPLYHLRFEDPAMTYMDGKKNKGIILKPSTPIAK